jgi:lipopolysaccharide export system protein LptA
MKNAPLLIPLAGLLSTLVLLSTSAPAQVIRNHNSNAPIDVDAGDLDIQDRADRAYFIGGVTIRQAGMTLRAARVTIAYTDGNGVDVNRVDATGSVVITKDDLRATSEAAIYDLDTGIITLLGNVNLTQGSNRLSGGRLTINLDSGRSTLSGGGPAGTTRQGGRVTGTFTVPQRKN